MLLYDQFMYYRTVVHAMVVMDGWWIGDGWVSCLLVMVDVELGRARNRLLCHCCW